MRLICSFFSLALHTGAALYLLLGPDVFPQTPPHAQVYVVELTKAPEPQPAPEIPPEPDPVQKPPPPKIPEPLTEQPLPTPQPAAALASPETPPPDPPPNARRAAAEADIPQGEYAVDPVPEPGVVHLSARKRPRLPQRYQPPVTPNATLSNTIVLKNESDDGLKRGAELRFALRRMASDDFTVEEDYAGHYLIGSSGRYVSVLGMGNGAMLLFDSQTGMLRSLARKGAMIYTYGPEAGMDAPVVGSVTFFPVKHKKEYQDSEKPGHLMWMPDSPPVMHWGTRLRFEERTVRLRGTRAAGRTDLDAELILPVGNGPWPGIVWIGGPECDDPSLLRGFARAIASKGIAVLFTSHRTCTTHHPTATAEAAGDALSALRTLRRIPTVDPSRTGLWGHGAGAPIALAAAGRSDAAFLICDVLAGPNSSFQLVDIKSENLNALRIPSLWMLAGTPGHSQLAPLLTALDTSAATSGLVSRTEIPVVAGSGAPQWLSGVSSQCLETAAPWLDQHTSKP